MVAMLASTVWRPERNSGDWKADAQSMEARMTEFELYHLKLMPQ